MRKQMGRTMSHIMRNDKYESLLYKMRPCLKIGKHRSQNNKLIKWEARGD